MIKHTKASCAALISKRLSLALIAATIGLMVHTANAATNVNDSSLIPVGLSNITTTKHELAVMQVLSEICPPMLNSRQKQKFYRTYNTELKNLLPSIQDPKAVMQYLATQQDYKNVLKSIRSWTMGFSEQENKALCEELAEASF